MEYIKIRADFKFAEKGRLYRIFLVPKGIGLYEMGCHIVSIFNGALEHCFLYVHGKTEFVQAPFMEDSFPGICQFWMGHYTVEDLPDTFDFEYDTGDGWYFKCKKYRSTVKADYEGEPRIVILEGAGQGIWEDNISTLDAYFEGKLDPNAEAKDFEDEERCFYLPWNVSIEKWGDYDAPLDPDLFERSEDTMWETSWKEELKYAKRLGLDKVKKDPDPFHRLISEDIVRKAFMDTLAETLAYAFRREDVIKKAEDMYGKKIGNDRYKAAFEEEITKVLTPKAVEKLFKDIEKGLEE